MTELQFPKHLITNKSLHLNDVQGLTIIGANGSGKSRLANYLMLTCNGSALSLSALRAIYKDASEAPEQQGSISYLFEHSNTMHAQTKHELEQLIHLLLADEMKAMLNYKALSLEKPEAPLPRTPLDTVVRVWQEIFPDNKILIHDGLLYFSNSGQSDSYSSARLSSGERAVLYYIGAILYAPQGATLFIEDPEMFVHPAMIATMWNAIERMRPDCTYVYVTHDFDFVASRTNNSVIWVRSYDPTSEAWDYEQVQAGGETDTALYYSLMGSRKPVLFIEGDNTHSIDGKLYPLVFTDFIVKPLGSCNKVIEAVRSFNDVNTFHHLDSWGIVDRDRRTADEVNYLRKKKIMVPEVAEVENILMAEEVIATVAEHNHRNPDQVVRRVKRNVCQMFQKQYREQALQHTRHTIKHSVEISIDGRFNNINDFEQHIANLLADLRPRKLYNQLCSEFKHYVDQADYSNILRVYNQKLMLAESNVAALCGYNTKGDYIRSILTILNSDTPEAERLRQAIRQLFKQ